MNSNSINSNGMNGNGGNGGNSVVNSMMKARNLELSRNPDYQDKMEKIYNRIDELEKLIEQNNQRVFDLRSNPNSMNGNGNYGQCKDLQDCQKTNEALRNEIKELLAYYKSYSINPNLSVLDRERNDSGADLKSERYLIDPRYTDSEVNMGMKPFKYAEIDPNAPQLHIPSHHHLNFVQGPWYGHNPHHSMVVPSKDHRGNLMPKLMDPYDMEMLYKARRLPVAQNKDTLYHQYDVTRFRNLPSFLDPEESNESVTRTANGQKNMNVVVSDNTETDRMMRTDGIEGFGSIGPAGEVNDSVFLREPKIVLQSPSYLIERQPFGYNKLQPPNICVRPPIVKPKISVSDTAIPRGHDVYIYEMQNFYGKRFTLVPGFYAYPTINELTSIKVPHRVRVTFYSQPRRNGDRLDIYGPKYIGRLPEKWLGNIAGIEVTYI